MGSILDKIWFQIVIYIHHIKDRLDILFTPLNAFGPAFAILVIAMLTVLLIKLLSRIVVTKRYKELKKEFLYWYNLRQEALKWNDKEKAKPLAKNIDQAKLNRLYYDYFLESFLLGLIAKYLPIFCALAYVNESYKPERMQQLFGRNYVFTFDLSIWGLTGISAIFWFIISLFLIYLIWFVIQKSLSGR